MDERSSDLHQVQYNRNALTQKIEFFRHNIEAIDKAELAKVLDSLFLTTGPTVKLFEQKFAQYVGAKYAVGVMSCTHALELALRYYDIGIGDEVITTPMSFVATANTIEYVGAKAIFVDVEPDTGNIDANLLEAAITPRTKAILVVHLYGQLCDMKAIRAIADKYNLKVIEDAAHCVEGTRDGVGVGALGDIACFSFYATKNLTCGEGGAITCNDPAIYEWMLKARQHGITKDAADRYTKKYEHYDMEFLGLKCNLSNINAALMVHQLDRLDEYLLQRQAISAAYDNAFALNPAIDFPREKSDSRHARHLYTIWVAPEIRDVSMHQLQDASIGVAVNFRTIHLMSYYRKKYGYKRGDFPIAERIGDSTISIPLYPKLTQSEISYIIDTTNALIAAPARGLSAIESSPAS